MKTDSTYTEEKDGIFLPNSTFRTHVISNHDETPHTHEFVEIFYILQGSVMHCRNDGQKQFLTAGNLVLLTPFIDNHYFKRLKNTPCLHRDIMVTTELLEETCRYFNTSTEKLFAMRRNFCTNAVSLSLPEIDALESQVNRILLHDSKDNETSDILIRTLLAQIVSKLLVADPPQKQENAPPWFTSFLALFTKADIIKEGLPALKKYMVLSYEHVCRLHKKILGKTIVEHLTETRMAYATHLLTTTDMSILEIAMECGYNSLSHFNHTFKKHYNVSPNVYKQSPPVPYEYVDRKTTPRKHAWLSGRRFVFSAILYAFNAKFFMCLCDMILSSTISPA